MMRIESKLAEMGLALPAEMKVAPGFRIKWKQVRVIGSRVVSPGTGHVDKTEDLPANREGGHRPHNRRGLRGARDTPWAFWVTQARTGDLDRVLSWYGVRDGLTRRPGSTGKHKSSMALPDLMIALFGDEAQFALGPWRNGRACLERAGHH